MNSSPDIKIFLIGNKSDLEEHREVQFSEGESLKNNYNLEWSCMQLCSVFPKSPVNVLSYFHNLKNNKKVIALKKRQTKF